MANKHLTQQGLNRVIFKILKMLPDQKIVISERELEQKSLDAIKIQHDPTTKQFVLSVHRLKRKEVKSTLILPGMN